jgi:hypothetical protein
VKVFDLDGNQVIEGEFETDNYGRFSIPIPTGLKFPVILLASFDIPEEQERTDAPASVVEESFYSEQILVNPVTSVLRPTCSEWKPAMQRPLVRSEKP